MAIELTGITWNHSRALPPLVATAQRYEELNPGVRVRWEKRSLHEFGHMPIDQLADRFDLIVIDHPWAGYCFARDLVHDLKPLLTLDQWSDLETNSVGPSFESYHFQGRLLALPIDAATPAPSCRPDLMTKADRPIPQTWSEMLNLADDGLAIMPGFTADLFLNWLMLAEALGGRSFRDPAEICDPAAGTEAMGLLKRLVEKMPEDAFDWTPIAIAERMTRTDDFAYCCFAYSYGNYCRPSFTDRPLRYARLPSLGDGMPLRSVVGGTGIALTRRCEALNVALDYVLFCASPEVQSGLYFYAGGQPSRREPWEDPSLVDFSGHFFTDAKRDHEQATVRPRYDGYVPLQEFGGEALQRYLTNENSQSVAWETLNRLYRDSRPENQPI